MRIGETANDVPKSDPEILQETFRSLVAELPSQLRSQLMKDMAKPGDQREAEFIALENSLMGQAKQFLHEMQAIKAVSEADCLALPLVQREARQQQATPLFLG